MGKRETKHLNRVYLIALEKEIKNKTSIRLSNHMLVAHFQYICLLAGKPGVCSCGALSHISHDYKAVLSNLIIELHHHSTVSQAAAAVVQWEKLWHS